MTLPRSTSTSWVPGENDVHTYKAAAETGSLAKGNYFIAVDPGTYSGGLKVVCSDGFGQEYHKSSTNPLEAAVGGIKNLGTVSNGTPWRYYRITDDKKVYASQQALLSDTGLLNGLDSFTSLLVNLFLNSNFPNRDTISVKAISYTYRSADPQGKPVELSALLYIRKTILGGNQKLSGITLANHGTIAANKECPTNKAQYEGAFAWKGYAIVMPDYYGFGFSKDRPQAYLDAETTARGNIDAYFAAVQLMTDLGVDLTGANDNLLSFGYSQGGFNSMANLKYATEHPELGVTFKKVMCGGSPFDVLLTYEQYLEGHYRNAIGFVPMTVVSMNESQKLNIPYDHLFKKPLLDNWQSWILSKDKTLTEINTLLGTEDLSEVMAEEMIAMTGSYSEKILATANRYSLKSGWTAMPASTTKIILYHSSEDDTVPSDNLQAMTDYFDKNNVQYEHTLAANGGHVNACISFIQNNIKEW